MAVIVLSSNQAYNPGADLWIVPNFENSKISINIDWYNNFLLGKTSRRVAKNLSSELEDVITETELKLTSPKSPAKSPIMIASDLSLPNRWTVMLVFNQDVKSWCKEIQKLYFDLKKPSMRIFLPSNLGINEFMEAWRLVSSDEDFSIVVEN
ncbi:MAG: hypothetical protein L6Q37_03000 [Bdellovibrionaceae bacterium]|nr:hypothetical protein [Pseudobdellovibrionaceae bacterium]NUM59361.1 hypothetical protein [Pseudobdellovibrionaceae bacterium]